VAFNRPSRSEGFSPAQHFGPAPQMFVDHVTGPQAFVNHLALPYRPPWTTSRTPNSLARLTTLGQQGCHQRHGQKNRSNNSATHRVHPII